MRADELIIVYLYRPDPVINQKNQRIKNRTPARYENVRSRAFFIMDFFLILSFRNNDGFLDKKNYDILIGFVLLRVR